jgi:hypothetical protein
MDIDSSIGKQISAEEAFEIIAEYNYKRDAELREMVFKDENKRILKKDKKGTCKTIARR